MLEKEVEQYLVWCVEMVGGKAYKFESPHHRGVSDRIVCLPRGETCFVELKRGKGGRLSAQQKLFASEMQRLNQRYACLWSIGEVQKWLSGIGYTTP